jgi:hypothetical protein
VLVCSEYLLKLIEKKLRLQGGKLKTGASINKHISVFFILMEIIATTKTNFFFCMEEPHYKRSA